MLLKDLLSTEVHCVDVYENVADLIGIAFEWDKTLELTPEGEKHFKMALNYKVKSIDTSVLLLDTEATLSKEEIASCDFEETIPKATQNAIEFFWALAGYCPTAKYDLWFKEVKE